MFKTILTTTLLFFAFTAADCQIDVKKMLERKAEKKAEEKVNKSIDKGFDKLEGAFKKDKKSEPDDEKPKTEEAGSDNFNNGRPEVSEDNKPTLSWSKFDFVPGDEIIFEDNLVNEENGEFPSRWDLKAGVVEIASFGGENVIMFRGGSPTIIPYLENSDKDYLPEVFTVEFDMYLDGPGGYVAMFLYDRKNQKTPKGNQYKLDIRENYMEIYGSSSKYPNESLKRNRWIHASVAYTRGKFKAYMDDTRLINIPRLDIDPTGLSFHCYHANDNQPVYIKNLRIAKGGVKYYDRILQDGKIISNGIKFEVNKATLKPESMGVINEIYELMTAHPDLNFSVEGHTDSDGEAEYNKALSEKRAKTVKETLIKMGIANSRLSSKGYGESNPIQENTTEEGKANNRRVEFVKI